jgi:hypothetical protein
MTSNTCLTLAATLLLAAACSGGGPANAGQHPLTAAANARPDQDEKVALDAVPQNVKDAAVSAVPGLILSAAEKEIEKGVLVYSLAGKAAGVAYEVEVTADGKVTEIEKEGAEGTDDDKDDDNDDKNDTDDDR